MHIISAVGRWRQEDHEFEASLGYRLKSASKKIRNWVLAKSLR